MHIVLNCWCVLFVCTRTPCLPMSFCPSLCCSLYPYMSVRIDLVHESPLYPCINYIQSWTLAIILNTSIQKQTIFGTVYYVNLSEGGLFSWPKRRYFHGEIGLDVTFWATLLNCESQMPSSDYIFSVCGCVSSEQRQHPYRKLLEPDKSLSVHEWMGGGGGLGICIEGSAGWHGSRSWRWQQFFGRTASATAADPHSAFKIGVRGTFCARPMLF